MLDVAALITFVAVIDTGSFSAAAERLGQTPSGVSRSMSRLEAQLGMTLMHRTTRRQDLTAEGAWLLGRARKVLAELEETEADIATRRSQPSGLVRVNAATPTLDHLLAPLIAEFLDCYPLIKLELTSGETVVDLIEERADLAIRIGQLTDSSLNARRLGTNKLHIVASPEYLAQHGRPLNPGALAGHRLLGFNAPALLNNWPLAHQGGEGYVIDPAVSASSGGTLRRLALSGAGIACLGEFLVHADIRSGRLVPVLDACTLPWTQQVWAVFYKQGALAPRVKALVDFLAARLGAGILAKTGT